MVLVHSMHILLEFKYATPGEERPVGPNGPNGPMGTASQACPGWKEELVGTEEMPSIEMPLSHFSCLVKGIST